MYKRRMILIMTLLLCYALYAQESLFEIKNADGKKVLEIANDGLRVFNPTAITTGEELDTLINISSSGINVFINNTEGKAGRRSFSVTSAGDTAKDPKNTPNSVFEISAESTISGSIDKPMMLWYPNSGRNAFRVGHVYIESPTQVGENSFATGYRSVASGNYSQALGYQSFAQGDYSTAIGYTDTTSGIYSTAIGKDCHSGGAYSLALGYQSRATDIAPASVALGWLAKAGTQGSIAMGHGTETFRRDRPADPTDYGYYAFAIGEYSKASGWSSTALGQNTRAYGRYSLAQGYNSIAKSNYSVALGLGTIAQPVGLTAVGRYNKEYGDSASWEYTNPIFVVGNGSHDGARNDAFTVLRDGTVAVDDLAGTGTRMVVADETGQLSTQDISGGSDNLGSHTATQNINLNGNYISNDGSSEGISISSTNGDVTTSNDLKVTGEVHRPSTGAANMLPIAYGNIGSDGSLNTGSGNISAVWNSTNSRYEITITGESYGYDAYVTMVTPITGGITATTSSVSGKLLVKIYNSSGSQVQGIFQFVTYKP